MVIVRMTWAELAGRADFPDLCRMMFEELLHQDISEEQIRTVRERYAAGDGLAICALDEAGNLCGCVSLYKTLDLFLLNVILIEHFIAVFPQYRDTTLFIRLVKEMEKLAREAGVAYLSTGTANRGFAEAWGRVFMKRGYEEMETLYRWRVR